MILRQQFDSSPKINSSLFRGQMDLLFSCLLACALLHFIVLDIGRQKGKKFKIFLAHLSQNEFRERVGKDGGWSRLRKRCWIILTSELLTWNRWVRNDGRRKFGHTEERKSEMRLMDWIISLSPNLYVEVLTHSISDCDRIFGG